MLEHVKSLAYVLVISLPALYLARQIAEPIITPREFTVWRNSWIAITIAAFLTIDFFVFAVVALLICLYLNALRAATAALFLVLVFAVPSVEVTIGGAGIVNKIIGVTFFRVLAVGLLIPILFYRNRNGSGTTGVFTFPDKIVVAYVALLVVLESRQGEITNVLRMATGYSLDILVPYFVFSRTVTSLLEVRKVLLAYVIATLPLALICVFEVIRGWHLYGIIGNDWGLQVLAGGYLMRGDLLRAKASSITPIVIGFVFMVAFGSMLGIYQTIKSRMYANIALVVVLLGLFAGLARGPWVGAGIVVVIFLATSINAARNLAAMAVLGVVVLAALAVLPGGERILNLLPFVGSVDAENVEYRKQLLDHSLTVIERNFWLGSVDYRDTPEMKELVQGQGIIDIVNHYIKIMLDSGIVGLVLYLGFFGSILFGLWRLIRQGRAQNGEVVLCARAVLATIGAILATLTTVSSIDFIPIAYWSFAGLSVAVIRIGYRERIQALARLRVSGAQI